MDTEEQSSAQSGPEPAGQPGQAPRRLLRSRDDRMIAGVAGGLGRYFDVDPVIVRIAFALTVLFGGLGIVAYIALALFVPSDDGSEQPQAPVQRSLLIALMAIVFLVLVALPAFGGGLIWGDGPSVIAWIAIPIVAAIAGYVAIRDWRSRDSEGEGAGPGEPAPSSPPSPPAEPGPALAERSTAALPATAEVQAPGKAEGGGRRRGAAVGSVLLALLIATAAAFAFMVLLLGAALLTAAGSGVAIALGVVAGGVLLVAAGLVGGGRWLVLPVAAIGLGVAVGAASDLDLDGGIGESVNEPSSFEAVPAGGYELGIGRLVVDLRDLEWRGRTLDLHVRTGIGEALVLVPERVCVTGTAQTKAGELLVTGRRSSGLDIDADYTVADPQPPELRLDADVGLGALRVLNDDTATHDERGRSSADDAAARDRNEAACAA
jgi:phage shock protein PspC (stress-responsive transcriptional regulator)